MASGINYNNLPRDTGLASQALEIERKDKELDRKLGYIGKLFGHGNNVTLYVSTILTLFLVLIGSIYSFFPINEGNMKPTELWKILTPFISTGFGFVVGKSGKL